MKRLGIIAIAAALVAGTAYGQTPEPIVRLRVIGPAEPLAAGRTGALDIELTIREPYHINSDRPAEEFLIPTTVSFETTSGVTFGKVTFPPAKMKRFQFSETPLSVFEGVVTITAEITPAADFASAEVKVEGKVNYQACDNRSCLAPKDITFTKRLPVKRATATKPAATPATEEKRAPVSSPEPVPATTTPAAPPSSPEPAAVPTTSTASEQPAERPAAESVPKADDAFAGKGLPLIFLLVFLGGLALNLTPCVYPIIPITISYFGGQTQGKKGGIVLHAILYVLGMAVTYSVLGMVAAFTGSLFGGVLQYPAVLVGISLVMVALALSMFDVYELRVPAFLNSLAGGSRQGLFGTFLMGLTVGIVAAPCIGPFVLGLLTYVGNRGNVFLGFSLFFVLSIGLGVPYLLLGVFSGSLNRLPRSGAWMVWVRKIFGFVLIAMAIYFAKSLVPNPLFYGLAMFLTMLLGGIYMAWVEPTRTEGRAFPYVRALVGLIFFAAALFFAVTGIRESVDAAIQSRMQGLAGRAPTGIALWSGYSEKTLADAARERKPVFIDFYTDWCIACKELDEKTFSHPDVVAAFEDVVLVKENLTRAGDERVDALMKKYAIRGFPTCVFLLPDGTEIAELRVTGYEPPSEFLPKVRRAVQLSATR